MLQENIENTRRLFQAVEDRDIAGVLAAYDPEIVISDAESLPYGGRYYGLEGAKQHVEGAAALRLLTFAPETTLHAAMRRSGQ